MSISISNICPKNQELQMSVKVPAHTGSIEISSRKSILFKNFQVQLKVVCIGNSKVMERIVLFNCTTLSNINMSLQLHSKALEIHNFTLGSKLKWNYISKISQMEEIFDINFTLKNNKNHNYPAIYMKDEELTDFVLQGNDGNVNVHKLILASYNPVFNAMIIHDCKESKEQSVELKDFSKATLKAFKYYIYQQKLPSIISEELLLLALRYMMDDLETACIYKLIENVTTETVNDLLDFAVENKCVRLKMAILDILINGLIKVDDLKNKLLMDKKCKDFVIIPTAELIKDD